MSTRAVVVVFSAFCWPTECNKTRRRHVYVNVSMYGMHVYKYTPKPKLMNSLMNKLSLWNTNIYLMHTCTIIRVYMRNVNAPQAHSIELPNCAQWAAIQAPIHHTIGSRRVGVSANLSYYCLFSLHCRLLFTFYGQQKLKRASHEFRFIYQRPLYYVFFMMIETCSKNKKKIKIVIRKFI